VIYKRTSHYRQRLGGAHKCQCMCEGLSPDLTFTENRDTPGIRSIVRFTTRASHYRQRLGGAQKCVCEDLTH